MELRHQHGVPSKEWIITLPGPGYRVAGDMCGFITVRLDRDEPATVEAAYKTEKDTSGIKRHLIVLTFSRVADGWAFLTICKGKHGMGERPAVIIE